MKDIFKKSFSWLLTSNRPKHIAVGAIIYFAMFFLADLTLSFALEHDADNALLERMNLAKSVIASATCLIAMWSNEHGQGKTDWLDIIAGCIPSFIGIIVFTLIVLV